MTTVRKYYEADGGQGGSPTAAQKEARRIVEMFNNILCDRMSYAYRSAKELSILHVKGIIEVLCNVVPAIVSPEINHWQSILSEIEKM